MIGRPDADRCSDGVSVPLGDDRAARTGTGGAGDVVAIGPLPETRQPDWGCAVGGEPEAGEAVQSSGFARWAAILAACSALASSAIARAPSTAAFASLIRSP
jgi:hypothetical protein